MHRLAYGGDAAAGQLTAFQGPSKALISGTDRGLEGCFENGRRRSVLALLGSEEAKRGRVAYAHFERHDITIICKTVH